MLGLKRDDKIELCDENHAETLSADARDPLADLLDQVARERQFDSENDEPDFDAIAAAHQKPQGRQGAGATIASVSMIAFLSLASCVSIAPVAERQEATAVVKLTPRVQAPAAQVAQAAPVANPRLDPQLSDAARQALGALLAPAAPAPSADARGPGVRWRGTVIDPEFKIARPLLIEALGRVEKAHGADQAPPSLAVVDYSLPTHKPRLYLVDLKTGAVDARFVTHGHAARLICRQKGANCPGGRPPLTYHAEAFSNRLNTDASSVGLFQVSATAQGCVEGSCGPKIVLNGLDPTNDQALARGIIFHKNARYFDPINQRFGRSRGCFVVAPEDIDDVVASLKPGAYVYAGPSKLHELALAPQRVFRAKAPGEAPRAARAPGEKRAERKAVRPFKQAMTKPNSVRAVRP